MKLTPGSSEGNVIQSFLPGKIQLRNQTIHSNAIISHDQLITDWAPPALEMLSIADFQPALDMNPDISGPVEQFLSHSSMQILFRVGIQDM
jgi:uncharacterized protein